MDRLPCGDHQRVSIQRVDSSGVASRYRSLLTLTSSRSPPVIAAASVALDHPHLGDKGPCGRRYRGRRNSQAAPGYATDDTGAPLASPDPAS
jgi:hypothetical protein